MSYCRDCDICGDTELVDRISTANGEEIFLCKNCFDEVVAEDHGFRSDREYSCEELN